MSTTDEPEGSGYKEELIMLNENVVKLLKSGMWDLATCAGGEPNVVPVAFKDVTADGKLVVGDVFLDTTPEKVIVTTPGADNKKEL